MGGEVTSGPFPYQLRRPMSEQFKGTGLSMVVPESEIRQPSICPFCNKPIITGGQCPAKEKGECGPVSGLVETS
jgi:hypothetical protein